MWIPVPLRFDSSELRSFSRLGMSTCSVNVFAFYWQNRVLILSIKLSKNRKNIASRAWGLLSVRQMLYWLWQPFLGLLWWFHETVVLDHVRFPSRTVPIMFRAWEISKWTTWRELINYHLLLLFVTNSKIWRGESISYCWWQLKMQWHFTCLKPFADSFNIIALWEAPWKVQVMAAATPMMMCKRSSDVKV